MKSRVAVAGYDRKGKQCTWSRSRPEMKVPNIVDLGRRRVHLHRRPNVVMLFLDKADPKSEVVTAGLLEMGAPSVAVQEVGVNIGGSIADADAGVCSVSDEEGVPLPPRSTSTSSPWRHFPNRWLQNFRKA